MEIPEGRALLGATLTLPKLAIGQYSLDVFLTEPFVEFIEKIEGALRFALEDNDFETVQPFRQSWGYGSVHLEMKVECDVYV